MYNSRIGQQGTVGNRSASRGAMYMIYRKRMTSTTSHPGTKEPRTIFLEIYEQRKSRPSHVYIRSLLSRPSRSDGSGESQYGLASHLIGRIGDITGTQARFQLNLLGGAYSAQPASDRRTEGLAADKAEVHARNIVDCAPPAIYLLAHRQVLCLHGLVSFLLGHKFSSLRVCARHERARQRLCSEEEDPI